MSKSVSQTIREDMNATIREKRDSNATIREGQSAPGTGAVGVGGTFRDYRIVRQLPSTSTEADIFVIEKGGVEYILKLYRYGIEPKSEILQSIKSLSETHPQNFIRVYAADFDKGSNRWFEIQEYAKAGTLQTLLDDRSKLTVAQQSTLFNDVAREIGESLNLLHLNNLLHLDIKPSNILLRSVNPLDMVLIDFGIATSLASDMSKKFTQTRGTPMYQSPESYTGGMGRASDWWGLGMILLEIAAGSHPFKGLSANVIAYSVATEPVNIPDNLDEGQRELFHGLLTRNPEKRWNWEQVSRWLKGERGIPQYFEETSTEGASNKNPFVFMNQKYQTLAEIAAAFARDEESWNKGKEFLMRGYVRQWMEGNQEFDASIELDNFLGSVQDTDEKMFRFIQKYGQNIPFIFCGKAITLQNLLLFTGKAAKRDVLTPEEKKIVDMIGNGRLLDCLGFCQQPGKDAAALRMALETFKGKSTTDVAGLLNFYLNPTKYYCPFVKDTSSPEKVIAASRGLDQPPRPIGDWDKLNDKYILPKDRVDSLSNAASYHATFTQLEAMAANGLQLIPRESNSSAEKAKKEALASASQREYTAGIYKWVLGYDDASLKSLESSLEKFRKQAAYASGFEKAQLDIWLAYLEFLEKRTTPLTDDDKKLLQNVRLKDADMVCSRLQVLVNSVPSTPQDKAVLSTPKTTNEPKQQLTQTANSSTAKSRSNQGKTKEKKVEENIHNVSGDNNTGPSISDVWKDSKINSIMAEKKNKGKSFTVSGKIEHIGYEEYGYSDDYAIDIRFHGENIHCVFPPNEEKQIMQLREGQSVTVTGKLLSSSIYCLYECKLVKQTVVEKKTAQMETSTRNTQSTSRSKDAEPSIFDVWKEYEANPIIAAEKYVGKTFTASGQITIISDDYKMYLLLNPNGKGSVDCKFSSNEKFQEGQFITVRGIWDGTDMALVECKLVK